MQEFTEVKVDIHGAAPQNFRPLDFTDWVQPPFHQDVRGEENNRFGRGSGDDIIASG